MALLILGSVFLFIVYIIRDTQELLKKYVPKKNFRKTRIADIEFITNLKKVS